MYVVILYQSIKYLIIIVVAITAYTTTIRLAFVIQGEGLNALGDYGKGMGYSGINNSLAIEFDTYFNHEENDPYENHISIHTSGWRDPISANHVYSLGHTTNIPDLTDGIFKIR